VSKSRRSRSSGPSAADRAGALADFIRQETTGGKLLLAGTAVALLWANLSAESYHAVWETKTHFAPAWLHLDIKLEDWAADGLLAIFFFVAGLEVKRELLVGELADRRAAALPVFAAVGGMVLPALVSLAASGGAASSGGAWAIPVPTDIAFALGVLALVGSALPSGVRVLLLSIAVIDDLLAIGLIAVVFTASLSPAWFGGGIALAALYWIAFRRGFDRASLLWILGLAVWTCVHASGVHATVAGILLGLVTPVRPRAEEEEAPGERLEHRLHPLSAGLAVPVFALAAAGIPLGALGDSVGDAVAIGVFAGLLVGKVGGILGGAQLAVRLRLGALPQEVSWKDVLPVAVLGAIGYTVSLLIAQLALPDPGAQQRASAAVLAAAVIASVTAVMILRRRSPPARD